jgi:hypothetical protein
MSQVCDQNGEVRLTAASSMNAFVLSKFLECASRYYGRIRYWRERVGTIQSYPFANYKSGKRITKTARRAYYCDVLDGAAPEDPFCHDLYNDFQEQSTTSRFINHINPSAGDFAARLFVAQKKVHNHRVSYLARLVGKAYGLIR